MKIIYLFLLPFVIFGQNNYAIDLNGSSQAAREVVANYRASDDVGFFSIWFQFDGTPAYWTLVASADEATSNQNQFNFLIENTDRIHYYYWIAGSALRLRLTVATTMIAGLNYHCILGSDGSQILCWINAVACSKTQISGTDTGQWLNDTPTQRDNLTIGYVKYTGQGGFFDGRLDEVSYFNIAPTQTIVDEIYNNGMPKDISIMGNIVGYWRLENVLTDDIGSITFDNIGSFSFIASPFGWDYGIINKGFNSLNTINKFNR